MNFNINRKSRKELINWQHEILEQRNHVKSNNDFDSFERLDSLNKQIQRRIEEMKGEYNARYTQT